LFHWNFSLT